MNAILGTVDSDGCEVKGERRGRGGMSHLRGGVPGVPCHIRGEVGVTVVHADRVDLLFVTFDAVGRTDVVTEDPSLAGSLGASQAVNCATSEHRVAQRR